MMMSLFSVFDPVSYFGNVNWAIILAPFLLVVSGYYFVGSKGEGFISKTLEMMVNTFKVLSEPGGLGISFVVVGVFMYISMENFLSLFPFVFTSTAHPSITLSLGVVGWMMCFFMGWGKTFMSSAAHLVPEGSPLILSFLLVIIESISHLIRPFTLSIRLAANMMAGHLIIGLISSISEVGVAAGLVSVFLQSVMLILESGVAIVQALVFSILLILYITEYY